VLISCWSVKGGSGTTVVAAALALALARTQPTALVDLAGDLPAALGLPDLEGFGLADWLAAGPEVPSEALDRIAVPAAPGLTLFPRGAPLGLGSGDDLVTALGGRGTVVADCGVIEPDRPTWAVAAQAQQSLLVLRPCYLALRRAVACPLRPSGVVLVDEPGRSLVRADFEVALGVPVRAQVPWTEAVARSVDAGLLASRMPRALRLAVAGAAA
jgi:hypothetical protein